MSALESPAETPDFHGDLALAAFSDRGPWQVVLEEARWLDKVPTIRSTVQRQIPGLIRPKKVPAGGRLVEVAGRLGKAVGLCLLYTSPSPRDATLSRMPSSA